MKRLHCATLHGYDACMVDVELSYAKGLPTFNIVGLPNSSIQESKERVKSALSYIDFKFPSLKVTINLSPSDISKSGTHFDLPIALIIALYNSDASVQDKLSAFYVFGELGLDGTVKPSSGVVSMIFSLVKMGVLRKVIVPEALATYVDFIPDVEIFTCKSLQEVVDFFLGHGELSRRGSSSLRFDWVLGGGKKYFYDANFSLDFADVRGQEIAKRAALIATAGFHNILLEGSPGCGKSMIAKRMGAVLPPMNLEQIMGKIQMQSLGDQVIDISPKRPFRSPHNSSTASSIFGGGSKNARVGEIALANHGVLFFDELPHFSKTILESMREPLEDHHVLISRVNYKINYEANFLFVGAMNPCPCGNLLSSSKECRCNTIEVQRYKNRLSDPFLDRIDLYVVMQDVSADDKSTVTSDQIFKQVLQVFDRQIQRGQSCFNARIPDDQIDVFCVLEGDAKATLDKAIAMFDLSFRSVKKITKVARTIADLDASVTISKAHVLEALSYRKR